MSLPFIVDIAIGLIFIYLILSLLASEIQELISTLLQWRAEHVKKSIEVLFSGSTQQTQTKAKQTRAIADTLYSHPLIRNLNQEAKGGWALAFRQISQTITSLIQKITKSENVFGKDVVRQEQRQSGPSYIPPETFATSMMETLKIKELNRMLIGFKLKDFHQKILEDIIRDDLLPNSRLSEQNKEIIIKELEKLNGKKTNGEKLNPQDDQNSWAKTIDDFKDDKLTFKMCIYSLATKLGSFAEECQENLSMQDPGVQDFLGKVSKIRRDYFGNDIRRQLLMNELKPKMTDVIQEVRQRGEMYAKIQEYAKDRDSQTYKTIQSISENLPDSVKESIASLAKKIDDKGSENEEQLRQLEKEIELWFDRSMQRASGVYKRNAKGVAILIGFLIAVGANADTLYIINSLSSNSVLRSTVSLSAERLVDSSFPTTMPASTPTNAEGQTTEVMELNQVKTQIRDALQDVSLPIGWNKYNLQGQSKQELQIGQVQLPFIHRVLGWFISGVAISMGSSFWFDLLSKVINIKNVGSKKSSF